MYKKRIFLIVLDSLGIGQSPDSAAYGDCGADTLKSISRSEAFRIPNLLKAGLWATDGCDYLPRKKSDVPHAALCRLREVSAGKDTLTGHREIVGIRSSLPPPTYHDGFPPEVIDAFCARIKKGVLCNKPYSGTAVINDFGEEHTATGKPIVYTSADSVFQIAAHRDVIPLDELYSLCRTAREILCGEHAVGRVIARPFAGCPGNYYRTAGRHDFALEPPGKTLLDALCEAGLDCIGVGKIGDIFAGRSLSESHPTADNDEGTALTAEIAKRDFHGLCFVNLVDFDTLYGHRRDADGYAAALSRFDAWLGEFIPLLSADDALFITADHGCDPRFTATFDHTREYVPLVAIGNGLKCGNLGTFLGFDRVGATVAALLGVDFLPEKKLDI